MRINTICGSGRFGFGAGPIVSFATGAMNILIPLDEPASARAIIEFLGRLDFGDHTNVRMLHVMNPIMVEEHPLIAYAPFLEPASGDYKSKAEDMLKEAASQLHAKWGRRCVINADVIEGRPEEIIQREAASWPADLLVLGTHDTGYVKRFLLGSVSSDMVSRVTCNTLVVR